MRPALALVLALLPLPVRLPAQAGNPDAGLRRIAFDVDEGTFLNVDVSPDGQTLVFDLLGDLYTLPIKGGAARPLLEGRAWERAPRYSPDGRWIAFVSDRDGGPECVWVARAADAGNTRAVTATDSSASGSRGCGARWPATGTPAWTVDGSRIVFGGIDSLSDNTRLRIVSVTGGQVTTLEAGAGVPRTAERELRVIASSATLAPDGKTAFFSETARLVCYTRREVCGHMPPRTWLYQLDLRTRQRRLLTDTLAKVHEFKPQLSRSGRLLAYLRRDPDGRTVLRVRALRRGTDRALMDIRDAVDPYRWGDRGDEVPGYAFTPDDRFIVIAIAGKLHRVAVADGSSRVIPFTVRVKRDVLPIARPRGRLADGPLRVRAVRWPAVSRDGGTLVFSAVGYLWQRTAHHPIPRRITATTDRFEYMPALAPDGRSVAYVAFEPTGQMGQLSVASLAGGTSRAVLADSIAAYNPAWSPDGRRIAFLRDVIHGSDTTGAVGWVDLATGVHHTVLPVARPGTDMVYSQSVSFAADGTRLLVSDATKWGPVRLLSVALDGSDRRELATADREIRGILPAPDQGHVLLITTMEDAWLAPLPGGDQPRHLTLRDTTMRRISTAGASFPVWQDARTLTYGYANLVYRYEVGREAGTVLDTVQLTVPRVEGQGDLVFRNARVITVDGDRGAGRVFEHGTVHIRGRRIVAVGATDSVAVPRAARIVDATGLTIVPGFLDVHYHSVGRHAGMTPRAAHYPGDSSAIAYGVTTGWDALNQGPEMSLALAELREAGRVVGPRWFSSGANVDPSVLLPIRSRQDAVDVVARRHALGVELVKDVATDDRRIRQWLADAARRFGVGIASHASTTGGVAGTLVRAADGYTGVEHIPITVPLYRDVRRFLAETGLIFTPTLVTADATTGPSWSQVPSAFRAIEARGAEQRAKLARYGGTAFLDGQKASGRLDATGAGGLADSAAIPFPVLAARAMAALVRDGAAVAISAHNDPGVLTHVEMWLLHRGGLPAGDVLRAATMAGASKLGYDRDIGSIEPGKIADLVVLTANPLDDMTNTIAIKYTVADGIVYDATTLVVVHR